MYLMKYFSNYNKKLEDIEIFFQLPYEHFINFVSQDDIIVGTEKEICEIITNYIKYRRNLSEPLITSPDPNISNTNPISKNWGKSGSDNIIDEIEQEDEKEKENNNKDQNDQESDDDEEGIYIFYSMFKKTMRMKKKTRN